MPCEGAFCPSFNLCVFYLGNFKKGNIMAKSLLFIVNPRAGKKKSAAPLFEAVSVFSAAGYLISVHQTDGRGDATRYVAQNGMHYDVIACCGGDGTLNETINGIMQLSTQPLLCYLPAGSTNDFAASLALSSNPETAAQAVWRHTPRKLDIGKFNQRLFAYVASFGAFTRASYAAPQSAKNALGHLAYILEGVKDLDTLRPYRVKVEADGEYFEGEFLFGAITNSTSVAGLMKIDPSLVDMGDGKFELLLIPLPKSLADLQGLLDAAVRQNFASPYLIFRHVSHVTVQTKEDLPWSLDGEYAPSVPEVHIDNLHHALDLLV